MAKNGEKEILCTIAGQGLRIEQLGEDPSWNCWGTQVGKALFLRYPTLDDNDNTLKIYKASLQLYSGSPPSSVRFAALQLGLPESEWDQITGEHILLAWLENEKGLAFQVAHLSLPMRPLYTLKGVLPPSEFLLKAVAPLPKLQNSEGWQVYCYWLHEEMERLLETFHLESMDVYTLQALFLDFVHEVRAFLLVSQEADIVQSLLKLGGLRHLINHPSEEDSITLEKILVKKRNEVRESLHVQCETLEKVVSVITSIEQSHPHLVPLKNQAFILLQLLGSALDRAAPLSIIQQLILLQLLNQNFGALSAVSSDAGFDRTSVAFSVQVATALLRLETSLDEILSMTMNWSEMTPPKERFKQLFIEVIERISIPLTAAMTSVQDLQFAQDKIPSSELLDLFPSKGSALDRKAHSLLTRLMPLS